MSINLVQHTSSNPLTANPTLAFGSDVTAGNLLIVAVNYSVSGDVTSITDTQGNTYIACGAEASAGNAGSFFGRSFRAVAGSTGANTVTVHNNSGATNTLFINEFSGVSALDQVAVATGTGTAVDSGGVTTTSANELLFGFYWSTGASTTQTPGAGWTALDQKGASLEGFTQYQIVSSTGTYDCTATLGTGKSGSPSWAAQITTFSADATAKPSGVSATSAVGTATAGGDGNIAITGLSLVSAVGAATPGVSTVASPLGLSILSSVGTAFGSVSVQASPSGLSLSSAIGTATVLGINNASPAGLRITSAVGTPSASGAGNANPSGLHMASQLGTVAAVGNWYIRITGFSVISEALSVGSVSGADELSITGFTVYQG